MKKLQVSIPEKSYNIYIGRDILKDTGELVRKVFAGNDIVVVSDENVAPLYYERVKKSLEKCGIDVNLITVPAGEKSKSFQMLQYVYKKMMEFEINRGSLIIALGGGVVGDLAGFAAATILRGVPYIQIPTSLLAQVDSSVGGKVAVNLEAGKNLAGAFYQPKAVIIDVDCLNTLDKRYLRDGMAEVIKYGAIRDKELFHYLSDMNEDDKLAEKIEEVIYKCCDIKRGIVEKDEKDTGLRMILNFGHTFGHVIEKHYEYERFTHGEAVGIGMVMAAAMGEKLGKTRSGCAKNITHLLEKFDLPTMSEIPHNEFVKGFGKDKKVFGEYIKLIMLRDIGEAEIDDYKLDEM